ncbi:translesion DNA synthesis-associated protein ImuA [Sediminicurvatus halobius]|uniref:Translesion DNA synthesis-associated protein ImuA n=1 Tax=Sediminicurvatus halobius TaxID=2182432 RepID=A0A2U2MY04_9GAMM|nr:translesion DNA synthesis-associated protein ImuA [Spiribacter halobius]PWG61662.1 translesion DNA synthesis-associated protein ImuA [Spiribacter halobius]UEX79439.1 translesion DNA synthesis-associated protein ImuA [Spiribacter halobius]
MENALDQLLAQPGIWRAGEQRVSTPLSGGRHIPSGFPELDTALPGGGLPAGALTEILHERQGIGELRLLMPALARLSREGRWIALIAPPYLPYAPALAAQGIDLSRLLLVHPPGHRDALWSVEQALRAGTCAAVLAWPRRCDDRSLRRLQLAAEAGDSLGLLFRPASAAAESSPAALRLHLTPAREGKLELELIKCRGGRRQQLTLYPGPLAPTAAPDPGTSAPRTPVTPLPRPTETTAHHPGARGRSAAGHAPGLRPRAPVIPLPRNGTPERPGQMDLPLPTPPRPGSRPQATLLPAEGDGRLTRLWKRLR